MKIDPTDYKFTPVDPDPNFDPEHNRQVIENSIKRADALWREKKRKFAEGAKERAEAVATYAESLKMGGADSSLTKYFGKNHLAYLRGYELIDRLKKAQQMGEPLVRRVEDKYAEAQQECFTQKV